MGTPYTATSVTGYNASPPPDDGTQSAANQVKWVTIKSKLPDPLKTALEAMDAKALAALDSSINSKTASYTTVLGDHLKTVEVATNVSSAVTISLGDAATMNAGGTGYALQVKNSGSSTVTVSRITGADTIDGAAKDLTLGPKQSAIFAVSGAGYVCLNGNSPIYDATDPSKSVRFDVSGVTTGTQRTITVPDRSSTLTTLAGDQTFTGALTFNGSVTTGSSGLVVITSKDLGTIASGTVTPDPQARAQQHYANNGAHTLAPSANVGSCLVDITNAASAGAITTSGFTRVGGSAFTTTNGHKFRCHISIGSAGSLLSVQALQ
jgi:hypothetical protein